MKRQGLGALYLADGVNVRYALNLTVPGGKVFVPGEGEALAFARSRDFGYVHAHHFNTELLSHNITSTWVPKNAENVARFAQRLVDLMKEHGVSGEPLGLDAAGAGIFLALSAAGVRIADAMPAVERARSIKANAEVAIYREIGKQYVRTIGKFRAAIRPGVSEKELYGVIGSAWYESGGEEIGQLNVCSGENMNPWSRWPTERKLEAGELVGADLHGIGASGLWGDVSRTFLVGDRAAAAVESDLYRRAYDYLEGATELFRGGVSFAEIKERVPEVPDKFRVQLYRYNIAHSIGLTPNGYPQVDKERGSSDDRLARNQVLAIESYFGEEGSPLAVKLEHQIVVRDGPPEILDADVPFEDRLL
jgi:Xaa-Pro aminopeptidase